MKTKVHQHLHRPYIHRPHIRYFITSLFIALLLTILIILAGYSIFDKLQ